MVKRLESSFFAFKKSLKRFHASNQRMIEMFENDKIFVAPDLDLNKYYDEGKEDEIEDKINELNEQSPNNAIYKAEDFSPELLEGLRRDQEIIDELFNKWESVDEDPKIKKFINDLKPIFLGKDNLEKKLVIFSESKETVKYLADELEKIGRTDVMAISASNVKKRFNTIRKNFDANYPEKKENDFNIIITTEVLAEGINLHRSNVILNYDIPWNATRLMQRIGRVNRIGTKAKEILIYNFYPTAQSNALIKLNEKALKKLQGFHSAFGEDSKIYSEQEEIIKNQDGTTKIKLNDFINSAIKFYHSLNLDITLLNKVNEFVPVMLNPLSHKDLSSEVYKVEIDKIIELAKSLKTEIKNNLSNIRKIEAREGKLILSYTVNPTTINEYVIQLEEDLFVYRNNDGSYKLSITPINKECICYEIVSGTKGPNNQINLTAVQKSDIKDLYQSICQREGLTIQQNIIPLLLTNDNNRLLNDIIVDAFTNQ